MPAMTASLDKSITKLNEDLMTQFTTLHTGEFVDPVCDPKVVLERLDEVRTSLEAMSEQADGYKNMQETFKLAPHEFTQLRDTISQYELKHEIWTKLNTWNEAQYQWKNEPFNELDVEEMVKEVQQYFKDVHKMAKRLPTDAVTLTLTLTLTLALTLTLTLTLAPTLTLTQTPTLTLTPPRWT